jgi:hypothetical protein
VGKYNTTYVCSKCFKDFDEGQHPGYFIAFDKCRGKTCPDCGRIRKLGRVRCLYENLSKPGSEGKSFWGCAKCHKTAEFFFNGICNDCFCEVQKQKNSCVCPFGIIEEKDKFYYCSFCEEFHGPFHWTICKKCAEKEDAQNFNPNVQKKGAFFSVGLPSVFVGVAIGLFLGWIFFVVLKKKDK